MNLKELIEKHAKVIFEKQKDLGYGPTAVKVLRDFATELLENVKDRAPANSKREILFGDSIDKTLEELRK